MINEETFAERDATMRERFVIKVVAYALRRDVPMAQLRYALARSYRHRPASWRAQIMAAASAQVRHDQ